MKRIILPVIALGACFLAACSGKATISTGMPVDSTTIKNKATALSAEQMVISKDADGLVKTCATGFVDYGNGEGKPMSNLDSIKIGLKSFYAAFPDYKGENLNAVGSGDTIVVTATWSGTFKNDFMGMKATGKPFKYNDADVFTFDKAGKITSHRSIQGDATMMKQLMPDAAAKK